jgi:hypothetical protein
MLNKPILIAAALLGGTWYMVRKYVNQQKQAATQMREEPRYLQTWEGEGGGVPVGGSRTAAQVEPQEDALSGSSTANRPASRSDVSATGTPSQTR